MKPGLGNTRQQRAILAIGLSGLVIAWIYFVYLIGPLRRQGARIARQLQTARQQLRALEASVANQQSLQQQYTQWDDKVTALRSLLPAREELPAVIERLTALATQTQVKIQAIFPQPSSSDQEAAKEPPKETPPAKAGKPGGGKASPPLPLPVVYEDVLIQIDASAGYHQLGTLIGAMESSDKPMRVASLRLVGNPKDPQHPLIKLVVRASFAATGALAK